MMYKHLFKFIILIEYDDNETVNIIYLLVNLVNSTITHPIEAKTTDPFLILTFSTHSSNQSLRIALISILQRVLNSNVINFFMLDAIQLEWSLAFRIIIKKPTFFLDRQSPNMLNKVE